MLIEEEEGKVAVEVNPDALEAVFEDDSAAEEEAFIFGVSEEEENEVDIAFEPNPENYW
jgi:hypothetical protein